jgi:SAM-dependent methyltransferase
MANPILALVHSIILLTCPLAACRKPAPAVTSCPELDRAGRDLISPLRERILPSEGLIARLDLHGDEVVADVGAGPGYLSLPLAAHLPRGRVLALDIEPSYLCALRQRAAAAGLANVEARLVSSEDPGLPPQSVDLALLVQVDHYLPDRQRYFRALCKALRPAGRIALVNYLRFRDADLEAARAVSLRPRIAADLGNDLFLAVLSPDEKTGDAGGANCSE